MKALVPSRHWVSAGLSASVGLALLYRLPFADENGLLQMVLLQKPYIFLAIKYAYLAMVFTTPYIVLSVIGSLVYIFIVRDDKTIGFAKLPPYPDPAGRDKLYVVVGEVHHAKRPEPVEHPQWLTIPDRGLYTGIAIFGAIGSGKTSGCIYPFAEQILAYRARERDRRVGGLVLEVKGDFCRNV